MRLLRLLRLSTKRFLMLPVETVTCKAVLWKKTKQMSGHHRHVLSVKRKKTETEHNWKHTDMHFHSLFNFSKLFSTCKITHRFSNLNSYHRQGVKMIGITPFVFFTIEVQVDWTITDYLSNHLKYATLRMGWWRHMKRVETFLSWKVRQWQWI